MLFVRQPGAHPVHLDSRRPISYAYQSPMHYPWDPHQNVLGVQLIDVQIALLYTVKLGPLIPTIGSLEKLKFFMNYISDRVKVNP
jgi:hypothetical protein